MVDDKLDLDVDVNAQRAERSLRSLARVAGTQAREIGRKFGEANKSLQRSGIVSEAETISALFIQVGGSVSRVASIVTSLIRPLTTVGTAFGATGFKVLGFVGAVAAVPFALAASIKAMHGLADGALAARDSLQKLGFELDRDALNSLQVYENQTVRLTTKIEQLRFSIGALSARELSRSIALFELLHDTATLTTDEVLRMAGAWDSARAAFGAVQGPAKEVSDTMLSFNSVFTGGAARSALRGWLGDLTDGLSRAKNEAALLAQSTKEFTEAISKAAAESSNAITDAPFVGPDNFRETIEYKNEQLKKAIAEREKLGRELRKVATTSAVTGAGARTDLVIGAEERAALSGQTTTETIGGDFNFGKLSDDYNRARMSASELRKEQRALRKDMDPEAIALFDEHMRKVGQTMLDVAGVVQQGFGDLLTIFTAFNEAELKSDMDKLQEKGDLYRDFVDKRKQLREDLKDAETEADKEEIRSDLKRVRSKIRNSKNEAINAQNAALKTWKANKRLQLAQVAINAAAAFGMTLATTPAPPPLNIGMAALSAAAVSSQAVAIATQQPPQFARGGIVGTHAPGSAPDSVNVRAEPGEGFVSKRGMGVVGREGLDAINQGRLPGNGPDTVVFQINLDGRKLAEMVAERMPGKSRYNVHTRR